MKILYIIFITLVVLSNPGLSDLSPEQVNKIIQHVSMDSLKKHIAVLGDDSLQGRATGTSGEKKAAQYLSQQFMKYKLTPIGQNGDYFQHIPMHGSIPLPESRLRLFLKENPVYDFELGEDYLLFKSGAQTFVPNPVPLVFVGYGIIAPEFDYNDYQSIDVEGKIVVYLAGEPFSDDSSYFNGLSPTIYSLPESKQRIALSRGALGSCLIAEVESDTNFTWTKLKSEFAFEDITLAYNASGHLGFIIHPGEAERLFEHSPYSLNDIMRKAEKHSVHSFPLSASIAFRGDFLERDFSAKNVVGMIEGSDLKRKNSYIIISAHFDHLGFGPAVLGDSIYNGVMDNASGCAALLEIARSISQSETKPKRSILFILTTGEEKGLLGATYYVDHPIFPLHKTIANINIDGLAMFDRFNDVIGIGSHLSDLGEYVQKAAEKVSVNYSQTPENIANSVAYSRSDQIAFAHGGIPSILIMEGFEWKNLSREQAIRKFQFWLDNIYHSPFDDLNQPLNYIAAVKHTQIILLSIYLIDERLQVPQWEKNVKYQKIRLQTIAEKR
jgi:hypothetical protein